MKTIPTPDPLKLKQLKPPKPFVKEKTTEKVTSYLTPTKKYQYDKIVYEKEMTWATVIREALKLYLEGDGTLHHTTPQIDSFVSEVLAILKYQKPMIPIVKRTKQDDQEWIEAKQQAVARKEVQEPLHSRFEREVIPLLKESFKKERLGLEHREIPFSELLQPDLTKEESKEKALENKESYLKFLELKKVNQNEFRKCKWKVKV